jgi:Ni,Fe-hydrogenase maturation factor
MIVIGVGNPYRRDDGLGPHVIDRLREFGLPDDVVTTSRSSQFPGSCARRLGVEAIDLGGAGFLSAE